MPPLPACCCLVAMAWGEREAFREPRGRALGLTNHPHLHTETAGNGGPHTLLAPGSHPCNPRLWELLEHDGQNGQDRHSSPQTY